jgi:hypothetical protein
MQLGIMQNPLYREQPNRYLSLRRLKPVTVGIAAICNLDNQGTSPQIVFCADRLMSAGVQFEGGESKIKRITDYCYVMQSATDSFVADLIVERLKDKVTVISKNLMISEIIRMLRKECFEFRKEWIEDHVLYKYDIVFQKTGVKPESAIQQAITEVENCYYPYEFELIVLGLEPTKEAHIYRVNEKGEYKLEDLVGFTTIGSGGGLSFLEMTKYGYSSTANVVVAIPRVYFAKRVSERAAGVGRQTDLAVLWDSGGADDFKPNTFLIDLQHPDILKMMDSTFAKIKESENKQLEKVYQAVYDMLAPKEQKKSNAT